MLTAAELIAVAETAESVSPVLVMDAKTKEIQSAAEVKLDGTGCVLIVINEGG